MPQIEIEYEMARQQYQKEFITNIDYEEITNLRESIRIRKEMVKDELVVDEMQLKSSLGLSYEDELEIREFMDIPTLVPPSFSIDESIEIALENRYEKKIADLTARQTEYEQRAAIGRDYPEISIEGFMGRSGQVYLDTDPPMADQWSVFLNLRWSFWGSTISGKYGENRTEAPIFHESLVTRSEEYVAQFSLLDGISHIYDKAEKEILKLQAIRDQRLTGEHVAQEVEKQYRNLLRSMELVEVTRKRLDVSRRNVDVVNKRRLLGEATIKDVMDAKHEGVQIESSLYENIFRFYIAAASLNRSCGMEIFPVNIWR